MLEDARHYAAPPESIAQLEADIAALQHQAAFEVWAENWQAFEIFAELCSQWLFAPNGGIFALNGQVVLSYLALLDEPKSVQRQLYNDVQLIASGAVAAWREQSERNNDDNEADDGDDE